jgi:hypothetical protein
VDLPVVATKGARVLNMPVHRGREPFDIYVRRDLHSGQYWRVSVLARIEGVASVLEQDDVADWRFVSSVCHGSLS